MNVVNLFRGFAEKDPNRMAILFPDQNKSISRGELLEDSHRLAAGLVSLGTVRGDYALIFLKPSLHYHALILALLEQGIIPVFIDPGMGRKNLFNCIKEVKPKILIAENILFYLKPFFKKEFECVKICISKSTSFFPNVTPIKNLLKHIPLDIYQNLKPDETCAVLYTSGGTGTPKGVEYTHQIFIKQVEYLQEMFKLTEDDIDVPGFPLFSMFTLCMGMCSSIPSINVAKPSSVRPEILIPEILKMKATFLAGSPAIWSRVGAYCRENNIILPTVKSVAMFGAPVGIVVHEDFQNVLSNGTTFTPYGATECLPIANVSGREILNNFANQMCSGYGTCLGMVFSAMEVAIFSLNCDDTLDGGPSRPGHWGEICVTGPVMTQKYLKNDLKTSQSKFTYNDKIWHRMGDLGYFDHEKNLWFGGRISHRVYVDKTMVAPIPVEALANVQTNKKRSALVKDLEGASIIIETNNPKELSKDKLLLAINKNIFKIPINNIYTTPKFPVDVRHNIKIDRMQLRHDLLNGKLKEL